MKWLEPMVVRLAGQAHLETTIPLIVAKLHEDGGDLLNEECAEALTRIGTPAVLQAVAEAFPTAEQHFRLYASQPAGAYPFRLGRGKMPPAAGHRKKMKLSEAELGLRSLLSQFAHGRHRDRTTTACGPRTRF